MEMAKNEKKYAYDKEYIKNNTKSFNLVINRNTDSDIIDFLETVGNKQAYVKQLIRADMANREADNG